MFVSVDPMQLYPATFIRAWAISRRSSSRPLFVDHDAPVAFDLAGLSPHQFSPERSGDRAHSIFLHRNIHVLSLIPDLIDGADDRSRSLFVECKYSKPGRIRKHKLTCAEHLH